MIRAIIAFWNDAATLPMAVASVWPYAHEVILVEGAWAGMPGAPNDGASTDGSHEAAQRIEEMGKVTRLEPRVYAHEREARNAGLARLAEGDWAIILDADEMLHIPASYWTMPRQQRSFLAPDPDSLGAHLELTGADYYRLARWENREFEHRGYTQTRFLRNRGGLRYTHTHYHVENAGVEHRLHADDPVLSGTYIFDWGCMRPRDRLAARYTYQRKVQPPLEGRGA